MKVGQNQEELNLFFADTNLIRKPRDPQCINRMQYATSDNSVMNSKYRSHV